MLALKMSAETYDAHTHTDQIFNHLEVGVNAGTTGIGINLSAPVTEYARVRIGADYMPRMCVPMKFNLMSYTGDPEDSSVDQDSRFERMSELLKQFTGFEIDRTIDMNAKGTMADFKLLVDVFPLRNKHFYATAGFYWGSAKVGHIENNILEAPTLVGVMIYNNMYDYFRDYRYFDEPVLNGVYIDPVMGDEIRAKFMRYGRVGAHMGDFNSSRPNLEGQPYLMEPDANGMVRADMYVNKFKPYLGLGYTTTLSKDGRWRLSVDAGALFWGKPKILTHEQYKYGSDHYGAVMPNENAADYGDFVNVATDVDDISGKVGKYVRLARSMHVYPNVSLRLSWTIF